MELAVNARLGYRRVHANDGYGFFPISQPFLKSDGVSIGMNGYRPHCLKLKVAKTRTGFLSIKLRDV